MDLYTVRTDSFLLDDFEAGKSEMSDPPSRTSD